MIRFVCFFTGLLLFACPALSATRASNYVSANTYNNMYPYMNNTMRTNLNPGVSPSQTNSQINVLTKTISTPQTTTRRVVPRSATSTSRGAVSSGSTMNARSATTGTARSANTSATARSATPTAYNTGTASNSQVTRRVVARSVSTARSATSGNTMARSATNNARASVTTNNVTSATRTTTGRTQNSYVNNNTNSTNVSLSSSRCLADYIDCMNGYCERENTAYNRCYCSAQLSQIDSTYQPEIDRLIKEIIKKQNQGGNWTDEEMNDYWMSIIGKYTGENSWTNLEDALNIDWAGTESRVRGQQAFATGHEYCVQHLRGCYYMAANLRDAYRSEIARDCAAYESSLQRLKNAAESILESYK